MAVMFALYFCTSVSGRAIIYGLESNERTMETIRGLSRYQKPWRSDLSPFAGRVARRSRVGWGKPHQRCGAKSPTPSRFARHPPRKGEGSGEQDDWRFSREGASINAPRPNYRAARGVDLQRHGELHTPAAAPLHDARAPRAIVASASAFGASNTSSSCTCSSICAESPASASAASMRIMARRMMSAAAPWIGALIAARS